MQPCCCMKCPRTFAAWALSVLYKCKYFNKTEPAGEGINPSVKYLNMTNYRLTDSLFFVKADIGSWDLFRLLAAYVHEVVVNDALLLIARQEACSFNRRNGDSWRQ